MSETSSTKSGAVLEPQLTLESFPRPSLTDERTPLLPSDTSPSASPALSKPPCASCSTFSRNFMLTTLLVTFLYISSLISTFFLTDATLLILTYTIQGCTTMWCLIVWFLHHIWLVEKPVKFMEPLHLSPHYYEILRFECLLERYVDVRNIAVAGGFACFELSLACGNAFAMVLMAYIRYVRAEVYGLIGEFHAEDTKRMKVVGVVLSSIGWVLILVMGIVAVKVIFGLMVQMVDAAKMIMKRGNDQLSKA